MDVHIGEVQTTVTATDSEALLTDRLQREIIAAVLRELEQLEGYRERRDQEQRLTQGATSRRPLWE